MRSVEVGADRTFLINSSLWSFLPRCVMLHNTELYLSSRTGVSCGGHEAEDRIET